MGKGINSSPQKRIEPFLAKEALIADPDLALDSNRARETQERTPKEWREKLRGLIEGAKNMTEGVSERFTKSKNYLNDRAKEIDAKAAEIGGVEKTFRSLGEKYNKLSLIHKLGVGVTLGVGATVFAASSPWVALGFIGSLGVQRAAGMASMFLKIEKDLQEKKVGEKSNQFIGRKERAMFDAMFYTVIMGAAIKEGLEMAREYDVVERTREWLGGMLGHNTTTPEATLLPVAPVPEVSEPAAATAAGEAIASAPTPEMPSVEASSGHGYEYMVKRLWEELQTKHLDPSRYAPDSDVHRLLTTDANSIDKVVHQIAADSSHGFFNADGTSVRINLDSHMTVNADGNIQLDDMVKAPEGAPTTPPYHPETPVLAVSSEEAPASAASSPPIETIAAGADAGSAAPPESAVDEQSNVPTPNQFGLTIPTTESHLYADPGSKHLFVYGGSPAERANAILEYLTKNPQSVVFSADDSGKYRIPWYLVEGKMTPGAPMRTSGFFGFFSSFMKAPEPEEFEKIIK